MSQSAALRSVAGPQARGRRWPLYTAALALGAVVAINLPLFLRMPLCNDAHYYDLCAHKLLSGQALYRDVFDNNLPGIVWLQAGVRSLLGWSPEALRAADFAVLACTAALLGGWWRGPGRSWATVVGTAAAVLAFAFATPESCHFQRDPIMLSLAAAALWLRRRQLRRLADPDCPARSLLAWGLAEGLTWGAAVWIKPFVVIPALACWAAGLRLSPPGAGRHRGTDAVGLLAGGLLAGALGVAALYASGSWADFRDIVFVWNREYSIPINWSLRLRLFFWGRFTPWGLLHLLALPLAARTLLRSLVRPQGKGPPPSEVLLAVCYLAWVAQALLIQREWTYVNVPPVVLAIALLAGWVSGLRRTTLATGAALGFLGFAAVWHPMFRPARLGLWRRCCSDPPSSRELRRRLALEMNPDWANLDRIADYLRGRHVSGGDVLCYHVHTVALYSDLGLVPATRFMYPEYYLATFHSHRPTIAADLAGCHPAYVVTDLESVNLAPRAVTTSWRRGSNRRPWSSPVAPTAPAPGRTRSCSGPAVMRCIA